MRTPRPHTSNTSVLVVAPTKVEGASEYMNGVNPTPLRPGRHYSVGIGQAILPIYEIEKKGTSCPRSPIRESTIGNYPPDK